MEGKESPLSESCSFIPTDGTGKEKWFNILGTPDGLRPANCKAEGAMRYKQTNMSEMVTSAKQIAIGSEALEKPQCDISKSHFQTSGSLAKLCKVCSKLDTQLLAHPLHPCRNLLPCGRHPLGKRRVITGGYVSLGSIDEVKRRRSTCDICKLVAEGLDAEPSDLAGECRATEFSTYCNFTLPGNVKSIDPSVTHFHLTQATVLLDTSVGAIQGPALPWEVQDTYKRLSHYVLHFQTKARFCSELGEATSVTPRSEHEFLESIGGRYVGPQVNTRLVWAWLQECECDHGVDCMPPTEFLARRHAGPALVVDVIDLCLVEKPRCRYVALSYVWGRAVMFKHLVENTQDLRKTGALRSLPIPATIRDAITLVHTIGERYLWVDSLCIIQDDLKMQQTEIMRMGSIYSRALFTIIAASGDHADSGLPGVGRRLRGQAQRVLKLANCELLTVIDVCNGDDGIDDTVWAKRAWTFQERTLSNRVLVFSKNQVYWRCRVTSYSEERALEKVRVFDQHNPPFPRNQSTDTLSWEPLQPLEYCMLYCELLYAYRQRHLTYQADVLNAFNGVTEMLAALQTDTFHWGLPGSLFSCAMAWFVTRGSTRNHIEVPIPRDNGLVDMIPIPSWSWAAWTGQDSLQIITLVGAYNSIICSLIQFNTVDSERRLVAIQERPWSTREYSCDCIRVRASWEGQDAHSHRLASPSRESLPKMGYLYFWSCFATVRVMRRLGIGPMDVSYIFFPLPDDFIVDRSDIIHQDFIVIAGRSKGGLILLAVEWEDGVAYRVGSTEITEEEWNKVENKQWQWITLG